ncbi:MAG: PAS domain-containing protein [Anaerolinea sp.]|nr:PAS domain-containing protein [Anaerolinea sp.]
MDALVCDFIFRRSPDGILIATADGIIADMNPGAAVLLGIPPESVIGSHTSKSFHNNPALMALFNRPGDQTLDVRLPRKRLASGVASTLADGRRIVLLHDVTERRDLDSRREALSTTMAHDLRNPISALAGYADLVARTGDLNHDQTYFLQRVRQTAQKLHDVAGELVDLVWLEAGMPLKHIPIEFRPVLDAVIEALTPLAENKQITIIVSVQDPLPLLIGDPDRIHQVLYKVLHNALLYSDEEQIVAVHAWGDDQQLYCSVADRGIGIAEDELDLVFDRLFRSKDERVLALPGGGLGLTIARRIVQRHGGDIWATSTFGRGSTFTFMLPSVKT